MFFMDRLRNFQDVRVKITDVEQTKRKHELSGFMFVCEVPIGQCPKDLQPDETVLRFTHEQK